MIVENSKTRPAVTALLQSWAGGNSRALNEAIPEIYYELRRLAEIRLRGRRNGLTLDAPALVNETYLRFTRLTPVACENRSGFFALAATIMRGILVDHVRAHHARKRGGNSAAVTLSEVAAHTGLTGDPDLLDVDTALHELQLLNARQAKILEMRFFGGLSIEETAACLKISPATVKREWTLAKGWVKHRLARPT